MPEKKFYYMCVALGCVSSVVLANYLMGWVQSATPTSRMQAVRRADQCHVLCIGSSHFQRGLDPRQYPVPLANLNHPGLNYVFAEHVLKPRLESSPKIQTVVLELGCTPLFRDTACSPGLAIWQLKPDRRIVMVAPVRLAGQLFPMLRTPKISPSELIQFATRVPKQSDSPGYQESSEVMIASGKERASYHNTLYSIDHREANTTAFHNIVTLCRHHDVRLVLLKLPCAPGYYDNLNPQLVEGLSSFIEELRDQEFEIVDCESLTWEASEFRDGDHVNHSGATKVADLLRPFLVPTSSTARHAMETP